MDVEMLHCEVGIPIECLGNTTGELLRRGAILENRRESGGLQFLDAQIPAEQFQSFRKWLEANTGGIGRVLQK
jgi:translation elongation factor EF-G